MREGIDRQTDQILLERLCPSLSYRSAMWAGAGSRFANDYCG